MARLISNLQFVFVFIIGWVLGVIFVITFLNDSSSDFSNKVQLRGPHGERKIYLRYNLLIFLVFRLVSVCISNDISIYITINIIIDINIFLVVSYY